MNDEAERIDEWADCLALIAQKDKRALQRFYQHFTPIVRAFAMQHGAPGDQGSFAEELAQEVMVKVWNRAETFDPSKSKVITWIYAIARNCRIDLLRKKSHQPFALDADDLWDEELEEGPLHSLKQNRSQADIKEKFKELSVEQSTVLSMVYFQGKSHSEIAADLDLPLGTVKSRVRLALKHLKVLFDR